MANFWEKIKVDGNDMRLYVGVAPELYHRDGPDCQDDDPTRRARLADRDSWSKALAFFKKHLGLVHTA